MATAPPIKAAFLWATSCSSWAALRSLTPTMCKSHSTQARSAKRSQPRSFVRALPWSCKSPLANGREGDADVGGAERMPGDFGQITEQLRRSTVRVVDDEGDGERGSGSGVIWDANGLIVTNAHVVRHRRPRVELWDGRS